MRSAELGPEAERPAVVVTAGTGAGKTESFLLPVKHDFDVLHLAFGVGVLSVALGLVTALVILRAPRQAEAPPELEMVDPLAEEPAAELEAQAA